MFLLSFSNGHALYDYLCIDSHLKDMPKKFTLETLHVIDFIPKEEQGDITANAAAVKVDAQLWNSSATSIRWHCRWTQKGLMPVKPAVHFTSGFSLGPNCALPLGPSSTV